MCRDESFQARFEKTHLRPAPDHEPACHQTLSPPPRDRPGRDVVSPADLRRPSGPARTPARPPAGRWPKGPRRTARRSCWTSPPSRSKRRPAVGPVAGDPEAKVFVRILLGVLDLAQQAARHVRPARAVGPSGRTGSAGPSAASSRDGGTSCTSSNLPSDLTTEPRRSDPEANPLPMLRLASTIQLDTKRCRLLPVTDCIRRSKSFIRPEFCRTSGLPGDETRSDPQGRVNSRTTCCSRLLRQ